MSSILRALTSRYLNLAASIYLYLLRAEALRWAESKESTALIRNEIAAEKQLRIGKALLGWLRDKLRAYPYWTRGHLLFSRYSLTQGDLAAAYASAMALKNLGLTPETSLEFSLLLGRCYLRSGATERAKQCFEQGLKIAANSVELNEELAACLMALGREGEAREILSKLDAAELSQEAKAALNYLARK